MKKLMRTTVAALMLLACGESGPMGGGAPPPPPPPPLGMPPGDVGFNIIDNAFVDSQGRLNGLARETMTASQMVGWIHDGANLHTVTFTSVPPGAAAGDSGNLTNGQSFEQTLITPGTYVFRCDFHPQTMLGATIIVS